MAGMVSQTASTYEFGSWLARQRSERAWSQRELAKRSGLHRSHLAKLELGLCQPTLTTLRRLREALGLAPTTFS
jgi:transcriptional regulator with XRE-family HTH domain